MRIDALALALALLLAASQVTLGDATTVGGYVSATDVTEHSEIDLDQEEIEGTCFSESDWVSCAQDIYENGKYSSKGTSLRTIQGFSTSAETKFKPLTEKSGSARNWTLPTKFYNYFGSWTWADDFVSAALDETGVFQNLPADRFRTSEGDDESTDARQQCVKKGTAYMATHFYALYEYYRRMWTAVYDSSDLSADDLSYNLVHAWDEGAAFWIGSLEDGTGTGKGPYMLAERRSSSFDTNTATNVNGGVSEVNYKILGASQVGRNALDPYDETNIAANAVEHAYDCIEQQAYIPLIQGCLLYTYKSLTSVCNYTTDNCGAEYGELYVFCEAWLPVLHAVNSSAATTIKTNANITSKEPVPLGFAATREAVYYNLNAMGIKCADVGPCTTCGDTTANTVDTDWCDDDSMIDYCGLAWPVDETSENDDENDDDWKFNTASIVTLIVMIAVLIIVLLLVHCMRSRNQESHHAHTTNDVEIASEKK